ncbi:putative C-terminal motor kinesin [Trypanosoma rangeli]|uniref:Putative C-terminal motor kinesin n=1 Tax=Trypanosoma rangeli TaxID=5698 RepID=A0A422NFE5_TRYRA|nr:putative C-terminal motor kinesin [Trypanosoma rangeli]RNF04166.1 putative C-terminal motor kinesin [Trypanosoma rangeli]|eukprot:RNF04166.1 putative C-terminal motor kinesin [Trypanosoma rangeli]
MSSMPSHVRIIVRTRPTDFIAGNLSIQSKGTLQITRRAAAGVGNSEVSSSSPTASSTPENLTFTFGAVLHNASQEAVFEATTADLVDSVLQGFNCTLLCYGQCGSGKTYTLFGGNTYPTRGCVPRAIQAMFETIAASSDHEFKVSLTFVEVHSDQLFDLLGKLPLASTRPGDRNRNANKVSVTLTATGEVALRGAEVRQCTNEAEALTAVFEGMQRRMTSVNSLNQRGSRSHAVLTLYVESKSLVDSDALVHHSQIDFVDLAGTERPNMVEDEVAKREAKIVNRSLMMFEQVVLALSGPQSRHVPYRQSKLTMLLKNSIGGTSRTTLIANIWPEERNTEATVATLNFAKRLLRIESNPTVHASMDPEAHIKQLQKQVLSLKSELRMQDQLAGREAFSTAPLDGDEMQMARGRVMDFVDGTAPQVRVGSVREMHACFLALKTILGERDAQLKEMGRQMATSSRPCSSGSNKGITRQKSASKQQGLTVAKEPTKFVASIEDVEAGVSVGTTQRPSAVIQDMFFQQRTLGPSTMSSTMQPGVRERSSDVRSAAAVTPVSTLAMTTATTAVTMTPTVSRAVTPAEATTPVSTNTARVAACPPPDGDLLKAQPCTQRVFTCPFTEKQDNIFPLLERSTAETGTPLSRFLGRQDNLIRDRRAAFETYKRTSSGACQLKSIDAVRNLLAEKNELILQFQKRLNEIQAKRETSMKVEQPQSTTVEERVTARCTSSDAVRSSPALLEDCCSGHDDNVSSADAFFASDREKISRMTLEERKAFFNVTNNALKRAMVERGHLVRQLQRYCEAFMKNFQYWHQSKLQAALPGHGGKAVAAATVGAASADTDVKALPNIASLPVTRASCVAAHGEADLQFTGAAGRLDAQEVRWQEQQLPESAAFYMAQGLARKGLQLPESTPPLSPSVCTHAEASGRSTRQKISAKKHL